MISCRHARHLFDAYLDDELSPGMRAELHAHRLACPDCSHELAILEACSDVIRTDRREPALHADFTDRFMVAFAGREPAPVYRWRRIAVFAGSPLAAAAVLVFAFAVWFPARPTVIGGRMEAVPTNVAVDLLQGKPLSDAVQRDMQKAETLPTNVVLEAWLRAKVDLANGTLNGAQQGASQLADFLKSRIAPPPVLLAGQPADKPASEAGGETNAGDESPPRVDTEPADADDGGQPASPDTDTTIELM